MTSAFQPGAFQESGFQTLAADLGEGFQRGAFQFGAFQTAASQVAKGAPNYGGKSKKKFVVRRGDRLLVFSNEKDALTILASAKEPQEIPLPDTKPQPKKIVREVIQRAEEAVPIHYVQEIAQRQGQDETVQRMLAAAQYAALIALVQQMQDEEDVEMLLMAV